MAFKCFHIFWSLETVSIFYFHSKGGGGGEQEIAELIFFLYVAMGDDSQERIRNGNLFDYVHIIVPRSCT